jgi:hypothetical protein
MPDVTLFENIGFQGRSITLSQGENRLVDFNDIASSIRVPPGMVALVFEDADASGGFGLNADFLEDCADLSLYYLNDKISYVSVFPATRADGQVWTRSQILNGVYWPGRFEQLINPAFKNPPFPTLSPALLPHILEISPGGRHTVGEPAVRYQQPELGQQCCWRQDFRRHQRPSLRVGLRAQPNHRARRPSRAVRDRHRP